jgi:glycosyltransferase involved in cell wall biosynthesis
MPAISILTGGHLCHNPRVIKEATALQDCGYDVEVLGGWYDRALKMRDQELMTKVKFRYRPLHDLTEQASWRFWLRLCSKCAAAVHARTGCETHWQLGYFVSALQKAVRRSRADLFIAHLEQALWVVSRVQEQTAQRGTGKPAGTNLNSHLSLWNCRLGVDMEDWFSEDLPPEARRRRPIRLLRSSEQKVLRCAVHTTCTSRAMSEALASEYGCRPPAVVYNAFPWSDRGAIDGRCKDRLNRSVPSVHWYSQTLGSNRGLDDLLCALPRVEHEAEIHLRGKPVAGFASWLDSRVPEEWRKRIFIHELVSNDELLSRIAEHDIGFAGEQRYCRSRDLTVTNKILHYFLGGLAVIASDTAGQCEIAAQVGDAMQLYPVGDWSMLAKHLNFWLESRERLTVAKAESLRAAENTFSWERISPRLIQSVGQALGRRH